MSETEQFNVTVPQVCAGKRLDQALVQLFPDYSRARLQQWIKGGHVMVDGAQLRPKDKVFGGERIELTAIVEEEVVWLAQDIPLEIIYEDEALLVINKPAGLVVHPGAGNPDGTLVNALLHYLPSLVEVPRAGVVHRLDKDTTGLMVVAKNIKSQKILVELLQQRLVKRQYEAVVIGTMTGGGTVDEPIGRHANDRVRMAVTMSGKHAVTHYRVLERFRAHTHVQVDLETGRTHQIRVHMAHIHHPLVGDPVYGKRLMLPPKSTDVTKEVLRGFKRQALHAARLGLEHPLTGEWVEWTVSRPQDMTHLLSVLRDDTAAHGDH